MSHMLQLQGTCRFDSLRNRVNLKTRWFYSAIGEGISQDKKIDIVDFMKFIVTHRDISNLRVNLLQLNKRNI